VVWNLVLFSLSYVKTAHSLLHSQALIYSILFPAPGEFNACYQWCYVLSYFQCNVCEKLLEFVLFLCCLPMKTKKNTHHTIFLRFSPGSIRFGCENCYYRYSIKTGAHCICIWIKQLLWCKNKFNCYQVTGYEKCMGWVFR